MFALPPIESIRFTLEEPLAGERAVRIVCKPRGRSGTDLYFPGRSDPPLRWHLTAQLKEGSVDLPAFPAQDYTVELHVMSRGSLSETQHAVADRVQVRAGDEVRIRVVRAGRARVVVGKVKALVIR